jgi:hypothetical protein
MAAWEYVSMAAGQRAGTWQQCGTEMFFFVYKECEKQYGSEGASWLVKF